MPARLIDGWPLRRLSEPPIKKVEPAWDAFPAGLRKGIDDYFAGLAKVHRSLGGKRIQPCSPTTIATRRAELVAMARMAVRLGAPIENFPQLLGRASPPRYRRRGDRRLLAKERSKRRSNNPSLKRPDIPVAPE